MIAPAQMPEMIVLARNLRPIDKRELSVTRSLRDWYALAADAMEDQAYCRVAWADGDPVFAFGATLAGMTTVQVWAFGTKRAAPALRQVTKHIKRVMIPYLLSHGVREAKAVSHPANLEAHRWLGYFGFKHKATISGLGPRREEMILFTVTADELRGTG